MELEEAFAMLDAWLLAVRAETMAPLHLEQRQGLRNSGIDEVKISRRLKFYLHVCSDESDPNWELSANLRHPPIPSDSPRPTRRQFSLGLPSLIYSSTSLAGLTKYMYLYIWF
jgi:hypothetical protein